MEVFKSFRLFGLYFYVSSIRMKRRRTIDEKMRNQHKTLRKKKLLLYKQQDGCCEMCGRHFGTEALEIHHLVGVRENPGLALATSNLVLLCHECHVKVHRKTVPRGEN
jgi:5-methylcytosine-specific restriction endonuclease McrA